MVDEISPSAGLLGSVPLANSTPSLTPSPSVSVSKGLDTNPSTPGRTSSPSLTPSPSVSATKIPVPSCASWWLGKKSPSQSSSPSIPSLGSSPSATSMSSAIPSPSVSPEVTTLTVTKAITPSLRTVSNEAPAPLAITSPKLSTVNTAGLLDVKFTPSVTRRLLTLG